MKKILLFLSVVIFVLTIAVLSFGAWFAVAAPSGKTAPIVTYGPPKFSAINVVDTNQSGITISPVTESIASSGPVATWSWPVIATLIVVSVLAIILAFIVIPSSPDKKNSVNYNRFAGTRRKPLLGGLNGRTVFSA